MVEAQLCDLADRGRKMVQAIDVRNKFDRVALGCCGGRRAFEIRRLGVHKPVDAILCFLQSTNSR